MNIPRPHVVFDCNILLQAIARPRGPAAQCVRIVELNRATLFLSKSTLHEFRKVFTYPEVRDRNPHITESVLTEFVSNLLYRAKLFHDVPRVIVFSRDPKDEPYLDLALAANADFLVSRDKDILSLTDDHSIEAKQFRQRCPTLRIVTPDEFLGEFTALP